MNRTTRAIAAIFFIVVIAISAVSVTQRLGRTLRVDMTDQNLYTLSDGSRSILAGLQQPLTLKLFYTKTAAMKAPDQIRFYNNYYTFVHALLDEYVAHSNDQVRLEVVDPRPYSDEEMAAIRFGLKRFQITEDENFFFGLVAQTEFGATRIIEFFPPDRQQFVEYDITSLIDSAITRQKKRLGILSALPVMGDTGYMAQMMQMQGQRPKPRWGIISHLEQKYEIIEIPVETEQIEADDIDLLLVIHPKGVSEQTEFAIDQYVLKGGRAVVLVDPHCVMDMPDPTARMRGQDPATDSDLPNLLRAWGLTLPALTFAGDRDLAGQGATAPNRRPERILGILKLEGTKGCFGTDHRISAYLNELTMVFPGVLKKTEPAEGLEHIPLLMTTDKGNSWSVSHKFEVFDPDYPEFLRRFIDGKEPVVMGYLVTGKFQSTFPEGIEVGMDDEYADVPEQERLAVSTRRVTGLTEAAEPGAVVVLADVDFISDLVAYQRSFFGLTAVGDNGALLINALEDLSGSAELISIRSRGNFKRPFTRVEKIELQARNETAEEEARIVAQIKGFEQQLNERLRAVKLQERQRIETLKEQMRNFCTLPGPILTLLIAIGLVVHRSIRRRYYISHASDA
jgi:ABC-type uncharacterized transport system involved in gliding motility auxiliary subunit